MSNILSQILDRGLSCNSKLLLPEKSDERIKKATVQLNSLGYNVIDIDDYNYNYDNYLEMLSKMKFCKNWPYLEIKKYLSDPINYGLMMVANNDADGLVAGATVSTADIIKKAIRIIGVSNSAKCVSSIFFMISQDKKKYFTYSDCGVIPEPDSVQLSDIAYNASKFHKLLSNEEPRVAFLSFSTKGSAKHYRVERVVEAVKLFGKKYGDILHDGELQFDAAIDSSIAKLKAPSSNLGGDSNVFIFPNLDSGNIAYKITQRIGGYMALGPLLQGLNKPVHDLSRGCNVEDVVLISAIAALQKNI